MHTHPRPTFPSKSDPDRTSGVPQRNVRAPIAGCLVVLALVLASEVAALRAFSDLPTANAAPRNVVTSLSHAVR